MGPVSLVSDRTHFAKLDKEEGGREEGREGPQNRGIGDIKEIKRIGFESTALIPFTRKMLTSRR